MKQDVDSLAVVHIKLSSKNAHIRRYETIHTLEGNRGKGRPNKKWNEVIKLDLV